MALTYFRHKVAITLTLFSIFLSLLFSTFVWLGIEKSDDNMRKVLLASHAERLSQYATETGKLWGRKQLSDIEVLVSGRDEISQEFLMLSEGYYEYGERELYVYVDQVDLPDKGEPVQVYLLHRAPKKDILEEYEPLIYLSLGVITVLVIIIGALVGLALAKKLSGPVQELSSRIRETDPNAPKFEPLQRRDEFGEISEAFATTLTRIEQVIEREKQFSRYASHELRTPVAVINSSLELWDLCERQSDLEKAEQIRMRVKERIEMASQQMQDVIETFLLLSKDQHDWKEQETLVLAEVLDSLVEKYQKFHASKPIEVRRQVTDFPMQVTSRSAVVLVISNALRNAFDYSHSVIDIEITENSLMIENDIDALRVEQADHFGFGLKIIEDLSQVLGWQFESAALDNEHYRIALSF